MFQLAKQEFILPTEFLVNLNIMDIYQECIMLYGKDPFRERFNHPSCFNYNPSKPISEEVFEQISYSLLSSVTITYKYVYLASIPINEMVIKEMMVSLWDSFFNSYFDYNPEDLMVDNEYLFSVSDDENSGYSNYIMDNKNNVVTLKYGLEEDEAIFTSLFFLRYINYLTNLFPKIFNYILQNPKLEPEVIPRTVDPYTYSPRTHKRIAVPTNYINDLMINTHLEYDIVCKTITI